MKLNWWCEIEKYKNEPILSFDGILIRNNKLISFYFFADNKMVQLSFNECGQISDNIEYVSNKILSIPNLWMYANYKNHNFILLGNKMAFDIVNKEIIYDIDDELNSIYDVGKGNEYHFENDDFAFHDYVISHKGSSGFVCHYHDKFAWKISCQGYLYTEMKRYSDLIVFGTAGRGGHFYGVNLKTGNIVIDINTGGTSKFLFCDNYIYLYLCGKKGRLVKVNESGEIADEILLPGQVYHECPLALINDKIYTLSFQSTGKMQVPVPILGCYSK